MPLRKRSRHALLAVALGALVSVVGLPMSSALAGCNPGRANDGSAYFAGWYTNGEPSTVTYNSSSIYNYANPYVYPTSGVFAWTMIVGPGDHQYAQIGWVVDSDGRHTFTEWNTGSTVGSDFSIAAQPTGASTWYEVGGPSGSSYCFFVNGSQVGPCTGALGWSGRSGQDFGEIHTLADQMPGAVHQPEQWYNSFIYYGGVVQHNFAGYGAGDGPGGPVGYFNYFVYSQTVAQAGDKACTGT